MSDVQPIVQDYLTQIFVKHYKMQPEPAAEEVIRFLEIIDLYKMQLIVGEWTIPEPLPVAPRLTPWEVMQQTYAETLEREPWRAQEIQ